MTGRLAGKRVFLTGAGAGIGRATALKMAAEGAALALIDRDADAADALADAITAQGGKAAAIAADVGQEASVKEAVAKAETALGGLDVLFNNAGIVHPEDQGPEDTSMTGWETTIAVNLTGVFLCCKHGIPALSRAGGGSIINTASVVALTGSAFPQIAYTAAKGGVLSMTREIAVVYARKGIRANALCPGPTGTALVKAFLSDEAAWNKRRPYIPMGRLAEPEEIANVVAFLASDEAAYMNGAAVTVDGGISSAYVIDDTQA